MDYTSHLKHPITRQHFFPLLTRCVLSNLAWRGPLFQCLSPSHDHVVDVKASQQQSLCVHVEPNPEGRVIGEAGTTCSASSFVQSLPRMLYFKLIWWHAWWAIFSGLNVYMNHQRQTILRLDVWRSKHNNYTQPMSPHLSLRVKFINFCSLFMCGECSCVCSVCLCAIDMVFTPTSSLFKPTEGSQSLAILRTVNVYSLLFNVQQICVCFLPRTLFHWPKYGLMLHNSGAILVLGHHLESLCLCAPF